MPTTNPPPAYTPLELGPSVPLWVSVTLRRLQSIWDTPWSAAEIGRRLAQTQRLPGTELRDALGYRRVVLYADKYEHDKD